MTSPEDLVDRLLAAEAELLAEFRSVSEPDELAEAEIRRARYVEIVRAWLAGR